MSDEQRLKALEARIAEAKGQAEAEKPRADEHYSMANVAWRMVVELVAGLGIGFGIGYGLDIALGTTPWLMILFIMFGLAAGVNVMMRTAKEVQDKQAAEQSAAHETEEGQ
ncbi:AtpZ/AtpI family protein [Shimia ponticola]|uniref:AtpZ/AtpI family protein n=1 Tax=Shimia ponticola TaxID=2582893 RepID=UPI0011BDA143|nr:AtpZ/AtpI family protein [Shimia ponticola]